MSVACVWRRVWRDQEQEPPRDLPASMLNRRRSRATNPPGQRQVANKDKRTASIRSSATFVKMQGILTGSDTTPVMRTRKLSTSAMLQHTLSLDDTLGNGLAIPSFEMAVGPSDYNSPLSARTPRATGGAAQFQPASQVPSREIAGGVSHGTLASGISMYFSV